MAWWQKENKLAFFTAKSRSYAPFREELRNLINGWIRSAPECIDFDLALRDAEKLAAFGTGYDSGDHLHHGNAVYKKWLI